MTPATLPALLAALAELVPERFEIAQAANGSVFYYVWRDATPGFTGHFAHVYTHSPLPDLLGHDLGRESALILEDALREEIESRGWMWQLEKVDFPHMPSYRACLSWRNWSRVFYADTPAGALALALCAALEGEG